MENIFIPQDDEKGNKDGGVTMFVNLFWVHGKPCAIPGFSFFQSREQARSALYFIPSYLNYCGTMKVELGNSGQQPSTAAGE